jgi:hypothetical protein
MLAGAMFVPFLAILVAAVFALPLFARESGSLAILFTRALTPTGWIGLPVLGAGLGALASLAWADSAPRALRILLLGAGLGILGASLIARTPVYPRSTGGAPRGSLARMQAIRRATYRSPSAVGEILRYGRDPDPLVRQQAVLAMGKNLVVDDLERTATGQVSPYAALPLRDSLRAGLLAALTDSVEDVRAEAARALWKAPHAFGVRIAAAETLAAVLDRANRPGAVERLAWLALDAAAGAPEPALKTAAARFAAATSDSELAAAARRAARP